jgi:hypothetical protein
MSEVGEQPAAQGPFPEPAAGMRSFSLKSAEAHGAVPKGGSSVDSERRAAEGAEVAEGGRARVGGCGG